MISVLILTYNEEENLPRCLESVAWSDDVLVVDSFSTDRTVGIAEEYGARVVQRAFDDFAGQRNYGLEEGQLKHDWVLHIDADEVVTPELMEELLASRDGAYDAYRLASKTMFQGKWLKYSGLYPSYQVRYGHRDRLRFVQVGHGQREDLPAERVGTLNEPLLHYSFSKGMEDWIGKHNRYSTDEAVRIAEADGTSRFRVSDLFSSDPTTRRRSLKLLSTAMPFRPTLRFLYMYLVRRGFLDGAAGYRYSRMMSMYEYMIDLKVREAEIRRSGGAL